MFKDDYDLENPPAKLELTTYGETTTHEWQGSDLSVGNILDALIGLLVAHTFNYDVVMSAMRDYLDEHYPEEEDKFRTKYEGAMPYGEYEDRRWVKTSTDDTKKTQTVETKKK